VKEIDLPALEQCPLGFLETPFLDCKNIELYYITDTGLNRTKPPKSTMKLIRQWIKGLKDGSVGFRVKGSD
jgi:hypothetical protein